MQWLTLCLGSDDGSCALVVEGGGAAAIPLRLEPAAAADGPLVSMNSKGIEGPSGEVSVT